MPISIDIDKPVETSIQIEIVTEPRKSGRMDVKTAFLNGYIEEDIFMDQPKGFESKDKSKVWLSNTFSIKDLGEATYILGIRIFRDRPKRLIGLSQALYLDKVLKRFNMQDSRRGLLPVRHGIRLSKAMSPKTPEEREKMVQVPYASAIGSLMYQSNPGLDHWTAIKNILKYLKRTKDMVLVYGGDRGDRAAVWCGSFKDNLLFDISTKHPRRTCKEPYFVCARSGGSGWGKGAGVMVGQGTGVEGTSGSAELLQLARKVSEEEALASQGQQRGKTRSGQCCRRERCRKLDKRGGEMRVGDS
ncbi:hypothetical protein CRG98_024831 [Punica granatum]|uniref:Reverse transcriptase Ty1/copia-type domain-containing protein n=1 Tax=Punica granatum TaxID=22663 RepID=A0A2I0JEW2_PUNGR|nr:hypothetical protein CRG98_024831 [Punica granatum]